MTEPIEPQPASVPWPGRSAFWLHDYSAGEIAPEPGEIPPPWAKTAAPEVADGTPHTCPDPDCGVKWRGGPVCWACGRDTSPPTEDHGSVSVTLEIDLTEYLRGLADAQLPAVRRLLDRAADTARQMETAMNQVAETINRGTLFDWVIFDETRLWPRRRGPAPLSIDGHAYHRRTRSRKGRR